MEVLTEVPGTGTKLRIDADREFEGQPGDSVLRVQGQSADGGQTIFDAAYVEVDTTEGKVISTALRQLRKPDQMTTDAVAQDVLAAFGSKLTARDAHQLAEIAARSWRDQIGRDWSEDERGQRMDGLAERFERASAQRKTPAFAGQPGDARN